MEATAVPWALDVSDLEQWRSGGAHEGTSGDPTPLLVRRSGGA